MLNLISVKIKTKKKKQLTCHHATVTFNIKSLNLFILSTFSSLYIAQKKRDIRNL